MSAGRRRGGASGGPLGGGWRRLTRRLGTGVAASAAVLALAASPAALGAAEPTAAGYSDTAVARVDSFTAPASYLAVSTQFTATSTALSDGFVWIWGYKEQGMSGNGDAGADDRSPQPVVGLSDVVKVVGASDLGEDYGTFGALTEQGEVLTWGSNKRGRLGIGTTSGNSDYRSTPQQVAFPPGERVIDIGSMRATMVALTESGRVYTWGSGQYGQAGNGSTTESQGPLSPYLVLEGAHSVHVGQRITWVVMRDNRVLWWGRSLTGESGNGTTATINNPVPLPVPALAAFASGCEGPAVAQYDPADGCSIRAITSSRQAGALLTSDGVVRTFGNDDRAQIGRPSSTATRLQVLPVSLPPTVTRLSAGNYHFTALTTDGSVHGWGDNAEWAASGDIRPNGTRGQGTSDATTPILLPLDDIIMIGGSRDTSYATQSDSTLIGWGDGRDGAIYGDEERRRTFTPLRLPGIRPEP